MDLSTNLYTGPALVLVVATVSFRVPDDLRRRMEEVDADWPALVRAYIEEEIRRRKVAVALERARRLRARVAGRLGKRARGFSLSAEVIRSRYEHH